MNNETTQAVGAPLQRQVRQHTPGPWHVHALRSASENHNGYRVTIGSPKWWGICTANPIDEAGREGFANASLIAAAPDLLAALQELRYARTDKAEAMADAAIARAVG